MFLKQFRKKYYKNKMLSIKNSFFSNSYLLSIYKKDWILNKLSIDRSFLQLKSKSSIALKKY
jgi:hypothetical protein